MAGSPESTSVSKTASQKLLIAADHAGFALKEQVKELLPNIQWEDLGTYNSERVDYPDFADRVASRISSDVATKSASGPQAILICGSGQGMAIRANRYKGVRAALVWNEEVATLARGHNDANILCLGCKWSTPDEAKKLIEIFLSTPFEGGRHAGRVSKIDREC